MADQNARGTSDWPYHNAETEAIARQREAEVTQTDEPEEAGSGSERWEAGDWTQTKGEGITDDTASIDGDTDGKAE